ncbi:MAG: hypothetical protein V4695_12795 [Pseudomonadota bacterium]
MNLANVFTTLVLLSAAASAASAATKASSDAFRNGIIGSGFITNAGSSTSEYKVLLDFKVHGRHRVELKFVERSDHEDRDLTKNEPFETVMVNCTLRKYTTSVWLSAHDDNYGFKQYQNGDAINWKDKSEDAYPNHGDVLPAYLKMVCASI